MDITEVFKKFPTQKDCLKQLEKARWPKGPECPYCFSKKVYYYKKEQRYHCNKCNTSFSVTVNTIFHDTKLPLQKWFLAISLILNVKKGISAKQLERDLKVTYKTAWYMAMRIRRAMIDNTDFLMGIIEMDETYVGGKPRKKNYHSSGLRKKRDRGTSKTPIIGMVEREKKNGRVYTQILKHIKEKDIQDLIRKRVNTKFSVVMTDYFSGYSNLNKLVRHLQVDHSACYVADGGISTNTIESFWAILKRGIVGQYHKVSEKFLPLYLAEFCFRYNNRNNNNLFYNTIERGVINRELEA